MGDKNVPGRENRKFKGLESEARLGGEKKQSHFRNSKEVNVARK